jgi:substrate import-associated zinc metallohydrolase lipoprotein
MYMKYIVKLSVICFLAMAFFSCKKDQNLNLPNALGLGGDVVAKTPTDQWLYDSLTKPYNIETKYRWDPWEVELDKTLVPPSESVIIPAMSAVKRIWINPYSAETGSDLFIKKYSPKEIYLVGSPQYNPNGTILLGQAEGGKKIELYVINDYNPKDIANTRQMLHTIEHEFAHILHQNVLYPLDFRTITPQYTSTWFNIATSDANNAGFITSYAMAAADEDFVEMVATMLIEGKNRYEETVTSLNTTAQAALRSKEDIVVSYFRQVWNIDFYRLQQRVQDALNTISPDPITDYYGFNGYNTTVSVNPANTGLTQGAGFTAVYNPSKTAVAALAGYGLTMDSMAVITNSATTAAVRVYLHTTAGVYVADFTYNMTIDASSVYTFTFVGAANGNATLIRTAVTPLLNYFINNKFKLSWVIDPNNTIKPLKIIFTPQQTANASFMGLLLP